jgi:hypothetical protein
VFEDIVQRGEQQARQPFGLTPEHTSELQKAATILAGVEKSCADERLSFTLNNMLDVLHRITAAPSASGGNARRKNSAVTTAAADHTAD